MGVDEMDASSSPYSARDEWSALDTEGSANGFYTQQDGELGRRARRGRGRTESSVCPLLGSENGLAMVPAVS